MRLRSKARNTLVVVEHYRIKIPNVFALFRNFLIEISEYLSKFPVPFGNKFSVARSASNIGMNSFFTAALLNWNFQRVQYIVELELMEYSKFAFAKEVA